MGRSAAELFLAFAAVVRVAVHPSLSFICVALTTSRPANLEMLKAGDRRLIRAVKCTHEGSAMREQDDPPHQHRAVPCMLDATAGCLNSLYKAKQRFSKDPALMPYIVLFGRVLTVAHSVLHL